jgi:rhodanese-related sulfurtransferase
MNEHTSARRAMEYRKMGYTNTRALAGGVEGWKKAGYGAA